MMVENFKEIAHDLRLALERERERLMEKVEEQKAYQRLMECFDQLISKNEELQEALGQQTSENDALHEQLQQEKAKSEELEMKLSELTKLSTGMAKKSPQEETIKILRTFVNKSKHKRIEKRIAVKEMVLEMAVANSMVFPPDLAATLDSLDDEQTETKVVNVQGNYNDIHDNGSVNRVAEGGQ